MKAKLTVEVITSGLSTSRVAIAGVELKVPTDLLEVQFAEEPTKRGVYRVKFADGTVTAVWRSANANYFRIGEVTPFRWQELGNIIECEPLT